MEDGREVAKVSLPTCEIAEIVIANMYLQAIRQSLANKIPDPEEQRVKVIARTSSGQIQNVHGIYSILLSFREMGTRYSLCSWIQRNCLKFEWFECRFLKIQLYIIVKCRDIVVLWYRLWFKYLQGEKRRESVLFSLTIVMNKKSFFCGGVLRLNEEFITIVDSCDAAPSWAGISPEFTTSLSLSRRMGKFFA